MKQISFVGFFAVMLLAGCTMSLAQQRTMTTSTGMELVWIPPGEFMMGSTAKEREWAGNMGCSLRVSESEGEPRRTKIGNGFWLARTETTVGQWRKFVGATDFQTDAERNRKGNWQKPKAGFALTDNHPVSWISWNDAMAFCEWLTKMERIANRLPLGMVYRLPTEAEWEYACRAGRQMTKFWWGDRYEDGVGRLNWRGPKQNFTYVSPVDHYGARGRNQFGLADMLGNVWEWCLDEFDSNGAHAECYTGNPSTRARRGGSCLQFTGFDRCATRRSSPADFSENHVGFRVCCAKVPGTETTLVVPTQPPVLPKGTSLAARLAANAEAQYSQSLAAATQQYLADLDTALQAAMRANNLDEAVAIRDTSRDIKGSKPVSPQFKGALANTAKNRYEHAATSAVQQYIRDLDAAQKAAMDAKNLDEANAISAIRKQLEGKQK
jgi:formylglycine-generating enzyme required for sulfatase activity